jgi:hypothetical protein
MSESPLRAASASASALAGGRALPPYPRGQLPPGFQVVDLNSMPAGTCEGCVDEEVWPFCVRPKDACRSFLRRGCCALGRACGFRHVVAVVDPAARSGFAAVSYPDKLVRLNDTVTRTQLQHEKQQYFERMQHRNERRDANRQRQGAVLADKAKHEGVVQDHKIAAAATGVLQRNPDVQPNRR